MDSVRLIMSTVLVAGAAVFVPATPATATPLAPLPRAVPVVSDPDTVPDDQRDRLLPKDWQTADDMAWTTSGDSSGFHLLVAESHNGYTWRTIATLAEPGVEADRWIGNACLTGSGIRAVVVYAPRTFTNRQQTFDRGGFVAVVNLSNGQVTKLPMRASLAYYNPGCGTGESAVLTQSGVVDLGRTRLHVVDTVRGSVSRSHELAGQVTSATPLGDRIVAAAGGGLLEVDRNGGERIVASTRGAPFGIRPDRTGGVAFVERAGDSGVVRYVSDPARGGVRELARGPLEKIDLQAGGDGRIFVTGAPTSVARNLPSTVRQIAAPVEAEISTAGAVATRHGDAAAVTALAQPRDPDQPRPLLLKAKVLSTGHDVDFQVLPGARRTDVAMQGRALSPALEMPGGASPRGRAAPNAASPTDPVDTDRTCSVPRNDRAIQVEQPHWKQVEWAADLAVKGALTVQRPANWKHSGPPVAWTPQGMFPRVGLTSSFSGSTVPASILLGVLSQESNLWQASWHALEGVTGNPLVGNFYGFDYKGADPWAIRWSASDCGYGVAQVTDGMRVGDTLWTSNQQRAIAVDYASNIAAGLRILEQKWNQTYNAGIRVNDADPGNIENWFAALWAYNTGINPQASTGYPNGCTPSPNCTDSRGNWGLGWTNNPANPDYQASRRPFLHNSPDDARHPQDWPYPEKVIGWAASPIVKYDFRTDDFEAAYAQAWWTDETYRFDAKPPIDAFCSSASGGNRCDINQSGNPCAEADFHCWWHLPVAWKPGCERNDGGTVEYTCGFDNRTYAPGSPEPAGGTHWPPVCNRDRLPTGAIVVDDVPDGVGIVRPNCAGTVSAGEFSMAFGADSNGTYPSKADFHQVGSGFDGHFYFAHTWYPGGNTRFQVTGTWKLDRVWTDTWARVMVHIPGHGAHTQQAAYKVDIGANTPQSKERFRTRHVNTASRYHQPVDQTGDRWVSLGVFNFNGTPSVSLSNLTSDGNGSHDIAFDAVAFQPMAAKPRHMIAVLGDSYSSGEGVSEGPFPNYLKETDNGDTGNRNACHRSYNAWSRIATLTDNPSQTITQRDVGWDNSLDYHMVACSFAQTENLLPANVTNSWGEHGIGAYREVSQIEQGYLDENTTLVAFTIGGNDLGWDKVVMACASNVPVIDNCADAPLPGETMSLRHRLPQLMTTKVIPSIETVISQIRLKADHARIVLMGYPRLISLGAWCLLGQYTLSLAEVSFIDEMSDLLAQKMRELVERLDDTMPITFSDPRDAFQNKGVCGIPEGIHGIIAAKTPGEYPDAPISQQSFHPNMRGTTYYADTFNATLRSLGL
ncbi:hypothetical protein I0C86_23240 [Plantactinospora sp. S1510]|uniref:SGNH hydrolase-type esterase domain-containing protein n=1 Tax=Plantactinospora alkalitolerans TaxID=2789879 RepID=A0ABS0H071_9ACTN|nr:GDSL-type esterase/lipase family protein [Plantactinospora alkalitolerans]MBF9131857.1 hypothetical protein [Plantactinospora alkalitolerans]